MKTLLATSLLLFSVASLASDFHAGLSGTLRIEPAINQAGEVMQTLFGVMTEVAFEPASVVGEIRYFNHSSRSGGLEVTNENWETLIWGRKYIGRGRAWSPALQIGLGPRFSNTKYRLVEVGSSENFAVDLLFGLGAGLRWQISGAWSGEMVYQIIKGQVASAENQATLALLHQF